MYSVIVGDIIQSRSLGVSDRRKTTVIFDEILEQINKKYQSNIMSSFGIVRGDGFEGVILSQQDIPGIVQDIIKMCWEKGRIKLRICAVVGELSEINLKRDKSDGPAFHKAVQEIDKMKADKSEHWFQVSIITNTIAQPLINSILVLLSTLTEGWTEKQTETVWAMSDHSNKQKLVSQKMNVSLSTVSKHLKSANYAAYNKAWSGIKEYLEAAEDALTERKEDDNKTNTFTSYYGMGLNKNKLNDLFMKQASMTCHDYLLTLRIDLAKSMLTNTELPINEIASRVGYPDAGYFAKIFKHVTGKTPSLYRGK